MPSLKYVPLLLLLLSPLVAAESENMENVVLERFSAARFRDLVTLNWNTLGERHNLGFEIERRSQFDVDWHTVAYVHGNSQKIGQSYSFVDKVQENTMVFYRLKQIDVFGNARFTPAVAVTPERFDASIRLRAVSRSKSIEYNQISLALPQAGAVRVRLFDALGRELERFGVVRTFEAGYHVIPFRSAELPAGVYSVRLETEEGTLVEMMLKTS